MTDRFGSVRWSRWYHRSMRRITPFLAAVAMAAIATADEAAIPLGSFEAFDAAAREILPEQLRKDPKSWRQIAPSVRWLLHDHLDRFDRLPAERQRVVVQEAAEVVLGARRRHLGEPVIGPGRPIVALLDPNKGLEPKQITTLAAAYGTEARVFKQETGQSIEEVAEAFLAAIAERAAETAPATVVVVGHGLPKEIQSYSIPVDRVAAALVDGAVRRSKRSTATDAGGQASIDLSHVVLIFDDCFSADFCLNLARGIRQEASSQGTAVASLPFLIAGANRDRYGIVNIGEKFVTHFWDVVIELYVVRTPHPRAVTLGNFFGNVDNAMYGYGRVPVFEGTRIVDYKLVAPDLVQDPVCFVPLTGEEVASIRRLFGLADDEDVLPLLDAG